MKQAGTAPAESWPLCYCHPQLGLFISIYDDVFKTSGPSANLKKGWDLINKDTYTDEPAPANLYLGCIRETNDVLLDNGSTARKVVYSMVD